MKSINPLLKPKVFCAPCQTFLQNKIKLNKKQQHLRKQKTSNGIVIELIIFVGYLLCNYQFCLTCSFVL